MVSHVVPIKIDPNNWYQNFGQDWRMGSRKTIGQLEVLIAAYFPAFVNS